MLTLLTSPGSEPVTLSEAKTAARFDGAGLDALIPGWITSARISAEHEAGRKLGEQTWRAEFDAWPAACDVIRVSPAHAAVVRYWNGSSFVVLASDQWVMRDRGYGVSIVPALNVTWPTLVDAVGPRVQVDVTCGYDDEAQEWAICRGYIMAVVASWIRNPQADTEKPLTPSPQFACMLDPIRTWVG